MSTTPSLFLLWFCVGNVLVMLAFRVGLIPLCSDAQTAMYLSCCTLSAAVSSVLSLSLYGENTDRWLLCLKHSVLKPFQ